MQYVKIIVNIPLSMENELIYAIPSELLLEVGVGKVVEVPLSNKSVYGVISGLTKHKPFPGVALPIRRILSTKPILSLNHLKLYSLISNHYICDLSDTVFSFLPPILKKIPVKTSIENDRIQIGKIRFIGGTLKERFDRYVKLINNFNGTLIFIFPDYVILNGFSKYINGIKHLIYAGNLNPTDRWKIWEKGHTQKVIILSTRIGIGLLPMGKYIIVVDDPDHPGFKEDQKPKYQIGELFKLHLQSGSNVVVGLSYPMLKYEYLFNYKPIMPGAKGILLSGSNTLPDKLITDLRSYKRVLIGMPHKNAFGLLICQTCSMVLRCNNCNKPIVQEEQNTIACPACRSKITGFPPCKNCHNNFYIGYQFGTNTIEREIKNALPGKQILRVDQNQTKINIDRLNASEIIIATSKIFDYPVSKFDLSICIGFDDILDAPFYNQEENCLALLGKFFNLGEKNVLVSNRTDHRVIQAIGANGAEKLRSELLKERYPAYPPYSRIVEIETGKKNSANEMLGLKNIPAQIILQTDNKLSISVERKNWAKFVEMKKTLPKNWRYNPDPR